MSKRPSIHTNAKLMRKEKHAPPSHLCTCKDCGQTYQGFGRTCPDCIDLQAEERDLSRMEANAILETREQNARENKPTRAEDDGDPDFPGSPTAVICDSCRQTKTERMNRFEREQFAYKHPDGLHIQACIDCCEIESAKHSRDDEREYYA